MTPPTHAYVGYDAQSTPILLVAEDGSHDTAEAVHEILLGGGRIERMTLEAARAVKLYERPAEVLQPIAPEVAAARAITTDQVTEALQDGALDRELAAQRRRPQRPRPRR